VGLAEERKGTKVSLSLPDTPFPRVILDAGMRHQQGLVGEMLGRGFGPIRHIPESGAGCDPDRALRQIRVSYTAGVWGEATMLA
jgi:hypothetical protein